MKGSLLTRAAVCLCVLATVQVSAVSVAAAGGVGDLLSPALGNGCGNHGRAGAGAASHTHGGTAGGSGLAIPFTGSLNHCGGADLPNPQTAQGLFDGVVRPYGYYSSEGHSTKSTQNQDALFTPVQGGVTCIGLLSAVSPLNPCPVV
ncbi:hypothetical protein [Streptomyces sp. 8P21H-1]|uniref:hypothetical protein n=1 Tax=Streptomyces sp. 8P21H-1 TaxID=2737048 RepID=UPI00156F7D09|nr:hypothetical protein [Streptomyces sp. 8P21H-1]NSL43465.1 hypothetical protein [Streptomyces sp. 8P21H-1]